VDQLRALIDALPPDLAARVFTHTSWTDQRGESYERLEFLGDGVLGLAVAEELLRRYPTDDEGRLAKLRAHVVSRRSCAVVARVLDLGARLERRRAELGAERAGLETNRNVLAEVCEAAIGGVFVANGYDATAKAVIEALDERITYAAEAFVDHKTELQELLARQGSTVSYALVEATGPAHRRHFTTTAVVDGVVLGTGRGSSKKTAEQSAAREALSRLVEGLTG
jgi:ribonuclease-3